MENIKSPLARKLSASCKAAAKRKFKVYPSAYACLLYTSPSPRDRTRSRMPSSA